MIETWIETVPVAVLAAAWFLAPGLLVGYLSGLRGIAAWSVAPALSVTIIAWSAVFAGWISIRWTPWVPAVATTIIAMIAVLLKLCRRNKPRIRADQVDARVAAIVGTTAASAFGALVFGRSLVTPDRLNLGADAFFHYNTVRWIVESGNASSFSLQLLDIYPDKFYPAALHDVAALTVLTGSSSIPQVINVVCWAISSLVWPIACIFLSRQVFGPRPAYLVAAGLASVVFVAFPWTFFYWGPLWSNALGYSLIPTGLGALVSMLGISRQSLLSKPASIAVFCTVLLATLLAHPNASAGLIILSAVPLICVGKEWVRARWKAGCARQVVLLSSTSAVLLSAVIYAIVSNPLVADVLEYEWPTREDVSGAVGDALLNAPNEGEAQWGVSILTVVGCVIAFRRRESRWLLWAHLATVTMYIFSTAVQSWATKLFTGLWFNDPYRLAGLIPLTGVLLVVAGSAYIVSAVKARVVRLKTFLPAVEISSLRNAMGATAASGVIVIFFCHTGMVKSAVEKPYDEAKTNSTSYVSEEGRFAFVRLSALVPNGSFVASNPYNGSPLLWATTGTRVFYAQVNEETITPDQEYLRKHLRDAAIDRKACYIARQNNVDYLLVSPIRPRDDSKRKEYPGLEAPEPDAGFQLVFEEAGTRLYKMTRCAGERLPHDQGAAPDVVASPPGQ